MKVKFVSYLIDWNKNKSRTYRFLRYFNNCKNTCAHRDNKINIK